MIRRGQTLLELVIATGVISISTIAVLTLIMRTIDIGQQTIQQTEAMNYAREGVEAVRMVRDSNWLLDDQNVQLCGDVVPWNFDGSVLNSDIQQLGDPTYCANLDVHLLLAGEYVPVLALNGEWQIDRCAGSCTTDQQQLYRYASTMPAYTYVRQYATAISAAVQTHLTKLRYRRAVTITPGTETVHIGSNEVSLEYMDIVSTVSWSGASGPHSITAQEKLYNWK